MLYSKRRKNIREQDRNCQRGIRLTKGKHEETESCLGDRGVRRVQGQTVEIFRFGRQPKNEDSQDKETLGNPVSREEIPHHEVRKCENGVRMKRKHIWVIEVQSNGEWVFGAYPIVRRIRSEAVQRMKLLPHRQKYRVVMYVSAREE